MADLPLIENDIYLPYKSSGLEVISVCLGENVDRISSTISNQNLTYRILVDNGGFAAKTYKIRGIPLNVIIDKKGIIRYRQTGYSPGAMKGLIEVLLKE